MSLRHKLGRWFSRKKPAPIDMRQSTVVPTLAEQKWGASRKGAPVGETFPRFQANANDNLTFHSGDRFGRVRMKLLEAFTPSQPVGDRKRFSGRSGILTALIRAIEEQRLHVVMYGARGLGKTSVLHVLTQAARDARYLVVYVSCGSDSNFDEVFRTVAANIPMLYHGAVGPTSAEVETGKTLADVLPNTPISARLASDLLAKLVGTRVVIVLDEFDRSESALFRRDIAELIKNLSDRLVRVQLVIAGVAANLTELIEHIPSIHRNIFALSVPWMTAAEIQALIRKGEESCGMQSDEDAMRAIINGAHGSPYLASLLGHHAGLCALDQGRTTIGISDVTAAVQAAIGEFKGRLSSAIQLPLWKLIREGHVRALGMIGGVALQCGGQFRKEDLRNSMTSLDIILRGEQLIPELVANGVLVEREQEARKIYRFAEDGIAPYLWLLLAQAQLSFGMTPEDTAFVPQIVSVE